MGKSDVLIVGGVVTVFAVGSIGSCSKNREAQALEEWQNAQGTQGFINLNDVKDAFRKNQSLHEFEKRVNEIYEGENLVVFSAREVSGGFEMKAYEDLDQSKSQTSSDDLLFTLSVKRRTATLKGAGVNRYYEESWVYEPPEDAEQQIATQSHSSFTSSPFFWYWVLSPGWGGYYTPVSRYDTLSSHRTTYRNSSDYRRQVSRNSTFGSQMSSKYGSSFRTATSSTSSQRKSYIRTKSNSAGFKEKLASSRSKTGTSTRSQLRSSSSRSGSFSSSSRSSSSSSSFGGFRGSSGFGV